MAAKMIRMLLLCLTVLVGSSIAVEDFEATLAFNKLLTQFRARCEKQVFKSAPSLVLFDVENGTETGHFQTTLHGYEVKGLGNLDLEIACEKIDNSENKVLCDAVLEEVVIFANMTIEGKSLPKSISVDYLNLFIKPHLLFVIEKKGNSLVKVESITAKEFMLKPRLTNISRRPLSAVTRKAKETAALYNWFSITYFLERRAVEMFNELIEASYEK